MKKFILFFVLFIGCQQPQSDRPTAEALPFMIKPTVQQPTTQQPTTQQPIPQIKYYPPSKKQCCPGDNCN